MRSSPAAAGQADRVVAAPFSIVIADDTATVRFAVGRALREEPGLELVGESSDGAQAAELVRRLRPDVALLDVVTRGCGLPRSRTKAPSDGAFVIRPREWS